MGWWDFFVGQLWQYWLDNAKQSTWTKHGLFIMKTSQKPPSALGQATTPHGIFTEVAAATSVAAPIGEGRRLMQAQQATTHLATSAWVFFKLAELKLVKKGLRLKGHYSWLLNFSEWWYKTYQPILKKLFSILQGSKVPKGLICLVPCIVRAWHVKDPTLDTSKTSLLFWLSYKRVSWSCCLVVSFWS